MKQDVAKIWSEALRSGDYEQGQSVLCKIIDGKKKWCCLGVLEDLAIKYKIDVKVEELSMGISYFDGVSGILGPKVMEWSGIISRVGLYGESTLAIDNDKGKTFAEIADIIDANWDKI